MLNAFRRHPANFIVKTLMILGTAFLMFYYGHQQGIAHAIQTAQVWSEGDVYLVDFDGQIHEYK